MCKLLLFNIPKTQPEWEIDDVHVCDIGGSLCVPVWGVDKFYCCKCVGGRADNMVFRQRQSLREIFDLGGLRERLWDGDKSFAPFSVWVGDNTTRHMF